ncbi:MAG: chitosanase [Patescibacteria group bacterium]|nr:chitosanase [Patescibacteria group bacterium]
MKNDIRPPRSHRVVPAQPTPVPAATPIHRKIILVTSAAFALILVVAVITTTVMVTNQPEASKNHASALRGVNPSSAQAVHPKRGSHKKLTYIAPGIPDPVASIASTAASIVFNASADLTDPRKKDIAMQLVSSAENSSLDWRAQYAYIEDISDGRGYTGGIIGFTSGTHDMLELVSYYAKIAPGNILAKYIPALQKVDGTSSHAGLDTAFVADWKTAAKDPKFQAAQDYERDTVYFNPSVQQAKADGLRALGQFMYYDAIVMHGPGNDGVSFGGIRATAMAKAKTPAQGGDETTYLNAFLAARKAAMLTEAAHDDTSRVDTLQRLFLTQDNLGLNTPLSWKTYGDSYTIN